MATHILLIRHGETDWNALGRWQGHAPIPLNTEGHLQARLLATYLAENQVSAAAIYTSDLRRALETAAPIAHQLNLSPIPDVRLREIDLGDWQGLTGDEIQAWDSERYAHVQADVYHIARPGGESFNQVGDRAVEALHSYVGAHPDSTVIVISHGGTLRMILHRLNFGSEWHPSIANTAVTTLIHDVGQWRLESVNRLEHLQNHRATLEYREG